MKNKLAIIGSGYLGLSAATKLADDFKIDIYDSLKYPGGLAGGKDFNNFKWSIEPFYHHWFQNETSIMSLAKTHKIENLLKTYSPSTSFYINGKIKPFDKPHHILLYPDLSLIDRFKLGFSLSRLKFGRNWKHYESITASDWLKKNMGNSVYEKMWKPMLIGKWGSYYNKINMAWFWARIHVRTQKLMYPKNGFQNFTNLIVKSLKNSGINFFLDNNITKVKKGKGGKLEIFLNNKKKEYDKVLMTTSPKILNSTVEGLGSEYRNKLNSVESMGAICIMFILKKPILKNTYWLNIPSPSVNIINNEIPFLVFVEHTNMIESKYYNNTNIVYAANYLPESSNMLSEDNEVIKDLYFRGIKKINPNFKKSDVLECVVSRTKYASPIFKINHSLSVPKFNTPIKNLFWASMSHVYPWDRGTNYASEFGFKVANHIKENIS